MRIFRRADKIRKKFFLLRSILRIFLAKRSLTIRKQRRRRTTKKKEKKNTVMRPEVLTTCCFTERNYVFLRNLLFHESPEQFEILMDSRKPFHFVEIMTVPFVFLARVSARHFAVLQKATFSRFLEKNYFEKNLDKKSKSNFSSHFFSKRIEIDIQMSNVQITNTIDNRRS